MLGASRAAYGLFVFFLSTGEPLHHTLTRTSCFTLAMITQIVCLQACNFKDDALQQEDASQNRSSTTPSDMSDMETAPDLTDDMPAEIDSPADDLGSPGDMMTDMSCSQYTLPDDSVCNAGACAWTQDDCDVQAAQTCVLPALTIDDDSCAIMCVPTPISQCVDDDECCPDGCDHTSDDDCPVPLLTDLCDELVHGDDLRGKTIVFDTLDLVDSCCDDLDKDGKLDNAWPDYVSRGSSIYNAEIDAAYKAGLVHMVLEFGGTGPQDQFSSATSITQHIGAPQCFTQIEGSAPLVYQSDADLPALAFDSFSIGKSLPPRLTAFASRMRFPMFGIREDIFYAEMRDARLRATLDETKNVLVDGTLSAYITPYDYFSAINTYYEETCPCFGDTMFELDATKQTYTCNDLSAHTCQDNCSESSGMCSLIINRFSLAADIDPDDLTSPCTPNSNSMRGTCSAISIGLTFESQSAYLKE